MGYNASFAKGEHPMTEKTTLSSKISSRFAGRSLMDFLSERFKYRTPEEWEQIIRIGKVTVNSREIKPDHLLKIYDIVVYSDFHREPPADLNIQFIHEEETFIVVNKPGNLPSHADGNYIKNTLINRLRERMTGSRFSGTIHLAHRLDRETSGIIIAAKTNIAHRSLLRQFEAGEVAKEYIAVVRGVVRDPSFEVKGYLARDKDSCISIKKKVVTENVEGAKYAATSFEVMERFASSTVVKCIPVTGRTNQIRIHLAHVGHPLVGDKLYGRTDNEFLEFIRNVKDGNYEPLPWMEVPRHLLHASRLEIRHPISNELAVFEAPIPEDMKLFICKNSRIIKEHFPY